MLKKQLKGLNVGPDPRVVVQVIAKTRKYPSKTVVIIDDLDPDDPRLGNDQLIFQAKRKNPGLKDYKFNYKFKS